jgi:hypothetical protein
VWHKYKKTIIFDKVNLSNGKTASDDDVLINNTIAEMRMLAEFDDL